MKRSHAKKIVENYFPNDTIVLEYKGIDLEHRIASGEIWPLIPNIETLAYSLFEEKKYTFVFPLFVELTQFNSTWGDYVGYNYVDNETHMLSYNKVVDWWKNVGQYTSLDQLICPEYLKHWGI